MSLVSHHTIVLVHNFMHARLYGVHSMPFISDVKTCLIEKLVSLLTTIISYPLKSDLNKIQGFFFLFHLNPLYQTLSFSAEKAVHSQTAVFRELI